MSVVVTMTKSGWVSFSILSKSVYVLQSTFKNSFAYFSLPGLMSQKPYKQQKVFLKGHFSY